MFRNQFNQKTDSFPNIIKTRTYINGIISTNNTNNTTSNPSQNSIHSAPNIPQSQSPNHMQPQNIRRAISYNNYNYIKGYPMHNTQYGYYHNAPGNTNIQMSPQSYPSGHSGVDYRGNNIQYQLSPQTMPVYGYQMVPQTHMNNGTGTGAIQAYYIPGATMPSQQSLYSYHSYHSQSKPSKASQSPVIIGNGNTQGNINGNVNGNVNGSMNNDNNLGTVENNNENEMAKTMVATELSEISTSDDDDDDYNDSDSDESTSTESNSTDKEKSQLIQSKNKLDSKYDKESKL